MVNVFKDLKDLAQIRSLLDPDPPQSHNYTIIKSTLPVLKNTRNDIREIKNKSLEVAKREDNNIHVILNSNFKSKNCKKDEFGNFLQRIDTGKECKALRDLYSVVDKNNLISDIPFQLDEGVLEIKMRQSNILHAFGVTNKSEIKKATYRDIISKDMFGTGQENNKIRFYFTKKENIVEIILVDIYHLFATEKYKHYRDIRGYSVCMNKLK